MAVAMANDYVPGWAVLVGDDGDEPGASPRKLQSDFDVLRLPFDTGVGYGRNALVSEAARRGYEFIVISDDDYAIGNETYLSELFETLLRTGADIVAPRRCNIDASGRVTDCTRNFGTILRAEDGGIEILSASPPERDHRTRAPPGCVRTDFIQNFFIARTEALLRSGWDDKLKNNDHASR
jgi:GT2 family glycosyltransferase